MSTDGARPPNFPGKGAAGGSKQPTLRAGRARKKNLCEGANSILYRGQVIIPDQARYFVILSNLPGS